MHLHLTAIMRVNNCSSVNLEWWNVFLLLGNLYSRQIEIDGEMLAIQVQDTPGVQVSWASWHLKPGFSFWVLLTASWSHIYLLGSHTKFPGPCSHVAGSNQFFHWWKWEEGSLESTKKAMPGIMGLAWTITMWNRGCKKEKWGKLSEKIGWIHPSAPRTAALICRAEPSSLVAHFSAKSRSHVCYKQSDLDICSVYSPLTVKENNPLFQWKFCPLQDTEGLFGRAGFLIQRSTC